jgi:hypothetical protein
MRVGRAHHTGAQVLSDDGKSALRTAAKWMNDTDVDKCMQCSVPFSLLNRRHRATRRCAQGRTDAFGADCRQCGRIFCGNCTRGRFTFPDELEARVCDGCMASLRSLTHKKRAPSASLGAHGSRGGSLGGNGSRATTPTPRERTPSQSAVPVSPQRQPPAVQKEFLINATDLVRPRQTNRTCKPRSPPPSRQFNRLGQLQSVLLVDVRRKEDYDRGHLPQAIHIPITPEDVVAFQRRLQRRTHRSLRPDPAAHQRLAARCALLCCCAAASRGGARSDLRGALGAQGGED